MQESKQGKIEQEQVVDSFEVEPLFEDRPHERLAFTFKIEGDEYKGHFHEREIQWMHPHPKQLIGQEKSEQIEYIIYKLMRQSGHMDDEPQDLVVRPAFEDRPHERCEFKLKVQGETFKGFIHDGEVQWFHPQPHQKLEDEQVEELEKLVQDEVGTPDEGSAGQEETAKGNA